MIERSIRPRHSQKLYNQGHTHVPLFQDEYIPPPLPFTVANFTEYTSSSFQFGTQARRKHFLLEDTCTFLNHGAFGASLKDGLDTVGQFQRYVEQQPLRFFDREMLPQMVYITRRMAKFVGKMQFSYMSAMAHSYCMLFHRMSR